MSFTREEPRDPAFTGYDPTVTGFDCAGQCPFYKVCESINTPEACLVNSMYCSKYGWLFAISSCGDTINQCLANDRNVRAILYQKAKVKVKFMLDRILATYKSIIEDRLQHFGDTFPVTEDDTKNERELYRQRANKVEDVIYTLEEMCGDWEL
jgi:hypothetical protein